MARYVANENTWVGFASTVAAVSAPTTAEIAAATDLTSFIVSIDASSQGNQLPTPDISTLFETTAPGTVQATFTAEMYRDDSTDTAWTTLPRSTTGFFIIDRQDNATPASSDTVEVWPVKVTSRTASPMASNDVQRFTINCAVTSEPDEGATVA